MKKVYLLTHEVKTGAGHGEPGVPYMALKTDGQWFNVGKPYPAFTTRDKALEFVKVHGFYGIVVTEIEIK